MKDGDILVCPMCGSEFLYSRFRAKRLTDFVMIMSIFPAMASFIMSLKAGR